MKIDRWIWELTCLGVKSHEIAASTLENTAYVPHYAT
jgi:hypothetical protein